MAPTKKQSTDQDVSGQQMAINAQYIKDLSFENPGAPASLLGTKSAPKIDLNVNINVQKLQENTHEVELKITAKATMDSNPLFLAELSYAGVFTLINLAEEHQEQLLLIYCPSILFPFARRIIADITHDGGFPPLMLDPIDFATMYQQNKAEIAKGKAEPAKEKAKK